MRFIQVTNATARAIRSAGASFAFSGYSSGLSLFAAQQTAAEGLLMLSAGSASTSIYAQNNLTYGLYPPARLYTASGLAAIAAAAIALDTRASGAVGVAQSPLPPCFGGVGCLQSLRAGFVQVDNLFTIEQCAAAPSWAKRYRIKTVHLPPVMLPLVPTMEQASAALEQLRLAGATVLVGCTYHMAALAILSALERLDWSPYAVLLSETVDHASFTARVTAGWWQGEYVLGPTPWHSSSPTHGAFSGLSSADFAQMYRDRFDGAEVGYNGAAQFAAACALGAAIEAANSTETATVATELQRLSLSEFYGQLTFGAERQISSSGLLVVQHAPGDTLKVVHSPADSLQTTGALRFPTPPWAQRRCRAYGRPQSNASSAVRQAVECSGHGACSRSGACECEPGFDGIACARSLLQACVAGYERDPDPLATEHCRKCEPGTWKGATSSDACTPCPALSSTPAAGATSRSQCECLPGFYATVPASTGKFDCRKCSSFDCPRTGTTLATIALRPGTWRLSPRTASIVSCARDANGTTPCRGGESSAVGYCEQGNSGAMCEVCPDDAYFSRSLASCTPCPAASSTRGALLSLALLFGVCIILSYCFYPSLVRVLPAALAIRFASATVVLWKRVQALIKAFDAKVKFKIFFSFYQAALVFPSAYQVALPDRYTQPMAMFSWLKLDGPTLLLPTACYPGGLASKLLTEALLPFALLAAILLGGYLGGRVQRTSSPATVGLPAALFILFLVIPKVSGAIFRAWDCAAFVYDDAANVEHFQLRHALAVRCSDVTYRSEQHEEITRTAFAMLWIWPIGTPFFFIVLLLRCRDDILAGRRSSLVRATSFLIDDYKPHLFFWEPSAFTALEHGTYALVALVTRCQEVLRARPPPRVCVRFPARAVEMARRLSITGFVLLVHDAQHRLYVAVMVSSAFAMLLAYLRPYQKPINNFLALGAQLATVSLFVAGIMLRLFAGVEKGFGGDRQMLQRVFGFGAVASIVDTMLAFNFGFLGLLALASLYQATHGSRGEDEQVRGQVPHRHYSTNDHQPLMRDIELEHAE